MAVHALRGIRQAGMPGMNVYLIYISAKIIRVAATRLEALAQDALKDEAPLDAKAPRALFTIIEAQIKLLRAAFTGD